MDELVKRLTEKQAVEFKRPEKNALSLKECIDRNYVHILFKQTGTELGVQLHKESLELTNADFLNGIGTIRLIGGLTLNYNKVKCIADIDLGTCEGIGCLESVDDQEYNKIMSK